MVKRLSKILLILGCVLLLCGCVGLRTHDEGRSKIATDTRQAYTDAKITEIPNIDAKNLATMLTAELDALRETSRIDLNIEQLKIANSNTPMGYTFIEAKDRLNKLGITKLADVNKITQNNATTQSNFNQLASEKQWLQASGTGIKLPECNDQMPESIPYPSDLQSDQQAYFQSSYKKYSQLCSHISQISKLTMGGKIGTAYQNWLLAKFALDDAITLQKSEADKVKAAKKAYDETVSIRAAAEKQGPELEKAIAEKAKALASAVEAAKKIDKGVEHASFIDSLSDILTATAGGNIDPKDPELQGAIAVAKQIPSLASDIAEFEAKRTAPPVSGLLIALRHQSLQADSAKKLAALKAERVAILKTEYDIYLKAAEKLSLYFYASCNYAALGAGKNDPGLDCNEFQVEKQDKNVEETVKNDNGKEIKRTRHVQAVRCELKQQELQDCLLSKTWKAQLRGHQNESRLKRKLYESVTAYLQAIMLEASAQDQSAREIDVHHRQTLVAKQTAIDQWDSLVSVPLEQLDAYYKAGIKPAELADLIVKALGFTAIAIGVAQ